MYEQSHSGLPLESDSSLTIAQEQKFTIREIAPEWGYASDHTKVLIIGTFTCDLSNRQWYCMFGETEVPAEIIQEGVLCCYAPTHLPAKVTLCLTSGNRESCSEIREFEYRDKPNNYINNNPNEKKSRNSEELLLLVRFAQMLLSDQKEGKSTAGEEDSWSQVIEALSDGSLASSAASDWLLEELLKDKLQQWLSSRSQNKNEVTALSRKEQGMIHMVSGLGFEWALNPILKSGVSVNFCDVNGWTALHWAARFGREKMVAELLASGAHAGAGTDPSPLDPNGQTPASIAATCGHKGLAGYLSELNLVTNDEPSLKDTLAAVRNATQAAARIQSAFRSYTLKAVLFATNNFSHENLITESPLGKVYRGQTENLVIQKLDSKYGQGNELQTEILTLKRLEHKNIASFFEYWVENNEKIIIYEAFQGTLNQHLSDPTLTWSQRLQICIGVARALNHIHYDIIHCDINSSKIILDEHWEPKIYGFELSTKYPRSWRHRLLHSHHFDTNNLTPKYDVYSFGVLMLEVLCGRKPMITNEGIEEELEEIIDPSLRTQMDTQALALFTNIAYKCLNQQHVHRPTMDQIIKELEDVLELQWEHTELKEHSVAVAADEDTPFNILKIPLREIRQATNGFNKACFVGSGGYADVYRAKLDVLHMEGLLSMEGKSKDKLPKISKTVAIKRISSRVDEQGKQGFLTELELLTRCKHPNIVSLFGFCRESGEMILVYEYAFKGSLADYLISSDKTTVILPWVQRIKICLDIAHGISYLHTDTEAKPRIIHRDIKSDNILLDENMNAKLADFGLSKSHPMNQQPSTIYSKNIAGTTIYMDPEYLSTGKYKRESDIYSFGVVLFEVLSGRVAYDSIYTSESDLGLAPIARRRFNEGTLQELIDPKIIEEDDDDHIFTLNRGPNQDSFHTFSKIAYQCLAETQANRPTINTVIKELQNALEVQGETVVLSRSRLTDIVLATENFAESYCIGLDTIGTVYKAELDHFSNNNSLASKRKYNGEPSKKRITVAIKRITCRDGGQGKQEFFEEIEMRTSYQHPNIVPLLGFCNEGDEMILVYESVAERSLNDYFKSVDKMYTFTWSQRLYMCLDIARGLDHLHTKIANPQRIIHVDIKSANILLDKNRGAKIGYFVTSELRTLANEEIGMKVYKDPEYETEGKPKENSDVYSFGVILFEIFCGRLAYDPVYIVENDEGLASIVRQRFDDGTIESMMDPKLKEETDEDINTSNRGPNKDSLATFLNIAYQCLEEAAMRPNMRLVIKELEKAIDYHMG